MLPHLQFLSFLALLLYNILASWNCTYVTLLSMGTQGACAYNACTFQSFGYAPRVCTCQVRGWQSLSFHNYLGSRYA
jgi:hypothetical protein